MNIFRKGLLVTAAAATLAIGAVGSARADTFASAILDINNFRLLHGNGAAYASTDFATLTGTNDAHATAALNGVFAADARSNPILSGLQPDVPQQCVGAPCPPIGENNFNRFPSPPPVPGNFGYADQRLVGSVITIGATPAGARATTRADASTDTNLQTASGNSDVGTSTTFAFTLGTSDTMTISFDANPYAAAFVSAGAGATSNANARMSWAINIVDLTTGASVFTFAPDELNALATVSRTDGTPGLTEYNAAGTVYSFLATTPLLSAGTTYQITIQHNTLANALQQEVPEPGTLAIVAAGLLSMSLISRRRKS
ncbi:putative secreted protein with PEP-CTERM sorting signal [Pseudoduganella lurida]|uniref:Putative secreted protein with PEP-CTERM sorting signal n=1 Tax=Pseudoduganella lurida TaxID=1036180 RepID=A0A562RIU3_9BURK|nr:EDSAP-1 family PEP-CTERM protein [Pseudoduganella lurida]TWI69009.1 putative secreted protein with PEP-CTERM sorting signal [Pseudoduganella lurida]